MLLKRWLVPVLAAALFGGCAPSGYKLDWRRIENPVVLQADEQTAYGDPAAIYHHGEFRLFYTYTQRDPNGPYWRGLATSTSRDLVSWSEPRKLTKPADGLIFTGPGNVIYFQNKWVLCCHSEPQAPSNTAQPEPSRLWIMRSRDMERWSQPEPLPVEGPMVAAETLGALSDPYLVQDKDRPGKWWCFYKQNGALGASYSYDLKDWTCVGPVAAGGNPTVLVDKEQDEYLLFCSGINGVVMERSTGVRLWRHMGVLTLGQRNWPWAQGRLGDAAVLDLRQSPAVRRYVMFFVGEAPSSAGRTSRSGSIAVAWSDDLVKWRWPGWTRRTR